MSISAVTPLSLLVAIARRDGIILSRDARAVGLERELRSEVERGHLVRLRWGAYTLAVEWRLLKPEKQYLLRVRALAAMSEAPVVFSHHSAAAIWDLPVVGRWPAGIEVLTAAASGGRSKHGTIRRFQDGPVSIVEHDGLLVTAPADTAVALARVVSFPAAVAIVDRAIHKPRHGTALATREELETALDGLPRHARAIGRSAAFRAVDFANPESGSAGESVSRALVFMLGFVVPELQVRFDDEAGFIAFVDFYWRTISKVGEFDGFGKYVKEEYTKGRTLVQVIMDEKRREDRVRACGPTVSRWDWDLLKDPSAFGRFLTARGVPQVR
ncbi:MULTISPECIES: hypothetical protein [unclassified Cryobacterium]|uniref:hypothetical protein n=1 Tax=unclassified Cryobacterium TaxID=2649013 RepID=UPI002AB3553E|nr:MULTISPECIES: hypothetical protein [unclassified Cryobacterium]MDY7541476.1 hypothetical protein [Cryobacterium sp. 5B3]MEA9999572.1 hypothetical protein [Cryobacterium sp. RTS3]MEB0265702.1 hypothetical protein [Cryobacterium sp. 10I5]MEB0274819.1 hypothetical protein [Cryobacterium sp. 5B3]